MKQAYSSLSWNRNH